jgi:hypothetical protein
MLGSHTSSDAQQMPTEDALQHVVPAGQHVAVPVLYMELQHVEAPLQQKA